MLSSPCFETIRVADRKLQNLNAHELRLNRTRAILWGISRPISLAEIAPPPSLSAQIVYKCKLMYDQHGIGQATWEPYTIRPIKSLRHIEANTLDYSHKYADRTALQELLTHCNGADDLLLSRCGLLTDTSYANIALFDGQLWHTPAQPLLPGTQRATLLKAGILRPADIRVEDLARFSHIKLINAMLPWEVGPVLTIAQIKR